MATPFDFTPAAQAPAALATPAQLWRVGKELSERDWSHGPAAYVTRAAMISATLFIAEQIRSGDIDPADLSIGPLSDPSDQTSTFHEMMAASQAAVERNRDAATIAMRKPLTRKGASALIDWLQTRPVKTADQAAAFAAGFAAASGQDTAQADPIARDAGMPDADIVPAGRYAIDTASPDALNALAFYRVDRPTEGRWAGRVFVKLITGGGGEQRLSWAATKAVLTKIAEVGAQAASIRYGLEIGSCGVCGRDLTNDDSRAAGIGPKCRAKMAW